MEHIRGDRKGFFRAVDGSVEAGLISYVDAEPDRMIIDHTEVAGHYSGEGVGKLLVVTLAEYARANSRKVIPLCSFARAVFDKMLGIPGCAGEIAGAEGRSMLFVLRYGL